MTKQITVFEFEKKVLETEEIVIVIRAPIGTLVDDYDYVRMVGNSTTFGEFINRRVRPKIGRYEVVGFNADGTPYPHPNLTIGHLVRGR